MRLAFYAPFKPLDHANPSGDLMIGRAIYGFLEKQGHHPFIVSRLRSRWIFWKPVRLVQAMLEQRRIIRLLQGKPVELWLTYHSYYKAPDCIGPQVCARLNIPYVIIQASYGTRVSRNWKSKAGFYLNRKALLAADTLITDRNRDHHNLKRIIPENRLHRIRPGLDLKLFAFNNHARKTLRNNWQINNRPVILAAAMFRPDVKTRSLTRLIRSCIRVHAAGHDFLLVIAGAGSEKNRLEAIAAGLPEAKVIFPGRIDRKELYRYYSAADIFAFPGINESLGMVFLEAQACGLPVIACDNGGIPEVVLSNSTGLLVSVDDETAFDRAIISLLTDPEKRKNMGKAAADYICRQHDINKNYLKMEEILKMSVLSNKIKGIMQETAQGIKGSLAPASTADEDAGINPH